MEIIDNTLSNSHYKLNMSFDLIHRIMTFRENDIPLEL